MGFARYWSGGVNADAAKRANQIGEIEMCKVLHFRILTPITSGGVTGCFDASRPEAV
jgi:hypothetical protein